MRTYRIDLAHAGGCVTLYVTSPREPTMDEVQAVAATQWDPDPTFKLRVLVSEVNPLPLDAYTSGAITRVRD